MTKTAEICCFLLLDVSETGLKPGYNCHNRSKAVSRRLLTAFEGYMPKRDLFSWRKTAEKCRKQLKSCSEVSRKRPVWNTFEQYCRLKFMAASRFSDGNVDGFKKTANRRKRRFEQYGRLNTQNWPFWPVLLPATGPEKEPRGPRGPLGLIWLRTLEPRKPENSCFLLFPAILAGTELSGQIVV